MRKELKTHYNAKFDIQWRQYNDQQKSEAEFMEGQGRGHWGGSSFGNLNITGGTPPRLHCHQGVSELHWSSGVRGH